MSVGASLLHGLILATAVGLLTRELTLPWGWWAGIAAAFIAPFCADVSRSARLRRWVLLTVPIGVLLGARLIASGIVQSSLGTELLGLAGALALSDAVLVGGSVFSGAFLLRVGTHRLVSARVVEASLVVAAVTLPLAAHRDGMIARPLELADAFWQVGLDPVYAFLGFGGLATLLAIGTLARDRGAGRVLLQLGFVALLLLLVGVVLHRSTVGVPLPPTGGAEGKSTKGEGKGQGQANQRPDAESDLQNGKPNNQPMAVVILHKDVEPFGGVFYFRHGAFSRFNGSRLVESDAGLDADVPWRFPSRKREFEGAPEGGPGRSLVASDVALVAEHRRMFTLISPMEVEPLPNPSPARFKRAYRALSSVPDGDLDTYLGRGSGAPSWSPEVWAHYTEIPEDARYLELATRLNAEVKAEYVGDPLVQALHVKRYLERTTIYAFGQTYEGSDPTATFLFDAGEDRKGYCTHISHAAAYLIRAMGVPARVSVGYAVMAENLRGGSSLLIRAADAHAWVEIHLEGVGWIPIEITPERVEDMPPQFEAEDLQRLLGEMARGEGRETYTPPPPSRWLESLKAVLRALPWLFLAVVVASYLWRVARGLRSRWAPEAVRPAYVHALDHLAAVGVVRRRGESRERFALRARALAPSLVPLTELVARVALSGRSVPGRGAGGLTAHVMAQRVGRELAETLPGWRRALGWLHPVPFWWSR